MSAYKVEHCHQQMQHMKTLCHRFQLDQSNHATLVLASSNSGLHSAWTLCHVCADIFLGTRRPICVNADTLLCLLQAQLTCE